MRTFVEINPGLIKVIDEPVPTEDGVSQWTAVTSKDQGLLTELADRFCDPSLPLGHDSGRHITSICLSGTGAVSASVLEKVLVSDARRAYGGLAATILSENPLLPDVIGAQLALSDDTEVLKNTARYTRDPSIRRVCLERLEEILSSVPVGMDDDAEAVEIWLPPHERHTTQPHLKTTRIAREK